MLSREKSADAVRQSRELAAARQVICALLAWLDEQELPSAPNVASEGRT